MAFTPEEKLDFIYRVAIRLAQEYKCLPYSEIWMHQHQVTEKDLKQAKEVLAPLLTKAKKNKIAYRMLEDALLEHGWDEVTAKAILGILYFEGSASMDLLDELKDIPTDVKRMMKKSQF